MTKEQYKTKTGLTQYRPVMTETAYTKLAFSDGSVGFCLACGEEADGVEPDARRYTCEACNQPKVYGLEELLMMGLVRLTSKGGK